MNTASKKIRNSPLKAVGQYKSPNSVRKKVKKTAFKLDFRVEYDDKSLQKSAEEYAMDSTSGSEMNTSADVEGLQKVSFTLDSSNWSYMCGIGAKIIKNTHKLDAFIIAKSDV